MKITLKGFKFNSEHGHNKKDIEISELEVEGNTEEVLEILKLLDKAEEKRMIGYLGMQERELNLKKDF